MELVKQETELERYFKRLEIKSSSLYDIDPELVLTDAIIKYKVAKIIKHIDFPLVQMCTWGIYNHKRPSVKYGASSLYAYPRNIRCIIVTGHPTGDALTVGSGNVVILTPNCELFKCQYHYSHLSPESENELGILPMWDDRQSPIGLWSECAQNIKHLLKRIKAKQI